MSKSRRIGKTGAAVVGGEPRLTIAEVAEVSGLSMESIAQDISAGRLPATKIEGVIYIGEAAAQAFCAKVAAEPAETESNPDDGSEAVGAPDPGGVDPVAND